MNKHIGRMAAALAAAVLLPLVFGGALCAQAPGQARKLKPKRAQLNPAYVEWQKKQEEREALLALGIDVEPRDMRLGHIPHPFLFPKFEGSVSEEAALAKAGFPVFPAYFDLRVPAAAAERVQEAPDEQPVQADGAAPSGSGAEANRSDAPVGGNGVAK